MLNVSMVIDLVNMHFINYLFNWTKGEFFSIKLCQVKKSYCNAV